MVTIWHVAPYTVEGERHAATVVLKRTQTCNVLSVPCRAVQAPGGYLSNITREGVHERQSWHDSDAVRNETHTLSCNIA